MTRRNQLLSRCTEIGCKLDALNAQYAKARPGSPRATSLAAEIRRLRDERTKLHHSLEVER